MADSPVLYVYYRPDNDDAYPGVPARHITEADWARFSPSQRRIVQEATTQDGYTRRKVWVHIDLVDETEQERAEREAREQAAREAYERGQSVVRWRDFEPLVPGPDEVIVGTPDGPGPVPVASLGGSVNLYEQLDIWPGYSVTGDGPDSWNGQTYEAYIDGFDNAIGGALSSGRVVKATVGTAEEGAPIYRYDAGDGPVKVFLMAGSHAMETGGMYASMRWFERFASDPHPLMRRFRQAFRVTFVPVLNADNYRVQKNKKNGVNLNRNWDFFWDLYSDASEPAGAAPFSEVETQLIRDLLTDGNYSIAIDCHNYASGRDMEYVPPSDLILGNRALLATAMDDWVRVYGGDDRSRAGIMEGRGYRPTFNNWAMWLLRHQQNRLDAMTLTLEGALNVAGSSFNQVTRAGMQAYCGYITTLLARWLDSGGALIDRPYAFDTYIYKYSVSQAVLETPVGSGGGTISATPEFVHFERQTPSGGHIPLPGRDTLRIAVPYAPAHLIITATGELASTGTAGQATLQVEINGTLDTWGAVNTSLPAEADSRFSFITRTVHDVASRDSQSLVTIRLRARMSTGTSALLRRCTLHVHVSPNVEQLVPTPIVRINAL